MPRTVPCAGSPAGGGHPWWASRCLGDLQASIEGGLCLLFSQGGRVCFGLCPRPQVPQPWLSLQVALFLQVSYYNQATPGVLNYVTTNVTGLSSELFATFKACEQFLINNRSDLAPSLQTL